MSTFEGGLLDRLAPPGQINDGDIRVNIFYAGAGGDGQGTACVPGAKIQVAANHWDTAIRTHQLNFPHAVHWKGEIDKADIGKFPYAELAWVSPECTKWSKARGLVRDFAQHPGLFGEELPDAATMRSRALMYDVPRYLEGMEECYGRPVLGGIVENVTDERDWTGFDDWMNSIRALGYTVKLIALNSMHAQAAVSPWAPQSRNRLYVAFWHKSLGRTPDWDKWLRPLAHCPGCDEWVQAVQWWKRPGNDMGSYGKQGQYLYRCPHLSCRNQVIEPPALPAAAIVDWSDLGTRVGDRKPKKGQRYGLADKTIARIEAGFRVHGQPFTAEVAGNTFERRPGVRTWPVSAPITTQTATATKALACPPMVVPAGGTWNDTAVPVTEPLRTRTTRETDGIAIVPSWITVHRGGVNEGPRTLPVTGPLGTLTAGGKTFGLATAPVGAAVMRNNSSRGAGAEMVTPVDQALQTITTKGHQSLLYWQHLMNDPGAWEHLVAPYYGTGVARPVSDPLGALSTKDRYALLTGRATVPIEDILFRMLTVPEIGGGMAFRRDYQLYGSHAEKIAMLGNAVTPPAAEVLMSALVEAVTGVELERWELAA